MGNKKRWDIAIQVRNKTKTSTITGVMPHRAQSVSQQLYKRRIKTYTRFTEEVKLLLSDDMSIYMESSSMTLINISTGCYLELNRLKN